MRFLDIGVIFLYLLGITWFGARFGRTQKTLKDYFLGGRNTPWWAIAFSIVSAETSTLTVIGTPARSFRADSNADGRSKGASRMRPAPVAAAAEEEPHANPRALRIRS